MGLNRRLVQNTGVVFIAGVFNKLFYLIFIAYAARVLGPGDFGIYALLGTISFMFFYFGDLGIGPMAVREIARDKARAEYMFSHVLTLRMCLIILAYPLLVLAVNLLGYSDDIKNLIYIAGISSIFSTFSASFGILYVAFERFKTPSIISILISFLSNASHIIVLYLGYGLKGVVIISLLGSAIGAVISGLWVRKKVLKYGLTLDLSYWKDIMLQSMPFAILSFLQMANEYINILLISKLPGPLAANVAIGYYNSSSSVGRAALMLPQSFNQTALPSISSNAEDHKMVEGLIDRSTKTLLAIVILPLVIVSTFFPKEIINIIFGEKYLPAAPALTIFGWAYALQVFNAPVSVTLSASREINRFIPYALAVLLINIALAVPFILYYGFLGAAVAFFISKIVETVLRNYLLQVVWGIKRLEGREYFRILLPICTMFIILFSVKLSSVNSWTLFFLTVIIYLVSVFSFDAYRKGILTFINGLRGRV